MEIFVISIEDDTSPRLITFLNQPFFKEHSISYKKIGIKGGQLSAKQYFEQAVRGRSKPLAPSELGCALSHIEALKSFLETDDEYALIFEDDAVIPNNITQIALESELKESALGKNILLSLSGIQMKECRKVRGEIISSRFLGVNVLEVVPDFYHRVSCAAAYIVDREMANTLINYHKPIRKADDWGYLFDFDNSARLLMTHLIDHPEIEVGEKDLQISAIEAERVSSEDIPQSKYGNGLRRNIIKLFSIQYTK